MQMNNYLTLLLSDVIQLLTFKNQNLSFLGILLLLEAPHGQSDTSVKEEL